MMTCSDDVMEWVTGAHDDAPRVRPNPMVYE